MKLFTINLQVPDDSARLMLRNLTAGSEYLVVHRRFIASVNQPGTVGMDQEDLLTVMEDISRRLSHGDSAEGYVRWGPAGFEDYMAWMQNGRQGPAPRPSHRFEVEACYRTGTLYGAQGGMRVIGLSVVDH